MRAALRPSLRVLLLAGLLAGGLCEQAQAGLADWFHGRTSHVKPAPKALHSSLPQPAVHPLRSARQGKVKPLFGHTRNAARTLVRKRAPSH